MNKKYEALISILKAFENGEFNIGETLKKVNSITSRVVEKDEILEYWSYTSLDELVELLLIPSIENWHDIDDNRAIFLITEIINNIGNDSILERNSDALEKRYSKPSGSLLDWIFYDDVIEPEIILERLKKDDVIFL